MAGRPFFLVAPANIRPKGLISSWKHPSTWKKEIHPSRSLIDKNSPFELISKKFVEKFGLLQSITATTLETSQNEFLHLQEFIELKVTWYCNKREITVDFKFRILDHDGLEFDMLLPGERLKDVSQDIIERHKEEPKLGLKVHHTLSFKKEGGKFIGVHVKQFCSNMV
jgi:hypothetical protein